MFNVATTEPTIQTAIKRHLHAPQIIIRIPPSSIAYVRSRARWLVGSRVTTTIWIFMRWRRKILLSLTGSDTRLKIGRLQLIRLVRMKWWFHPVDTQAVIYSSSLQKLRRELLFTSQVTKSFSQRFKSQIESILIHLKLKTLNHSELQLFPR